MSKTTNPPRFIHESFPLDMKKLSEKNPRKICVYELQPNGDLKPSIRIAPSLSSFIPSDSSFEVSPIDMINPFDKLDYANALENDIYKDTDLF